MLLLSAATVSAQTSFKKRYGTSGNDRAWCVEVLPDNSFIVAGGTTGGGLGAEDAILTKFSADGTVEWSKVFGGGNYEYFTHMLACSDGNFLALGPTTSLGAGAWDIYIVKFDANGNVLWERTQGGTNQDLPNGVCEASDGYVITGGCTNCGPGAYNILVSKIDFDGNTLWTRVYGSSGQDLGGKPIEMPNGQIWLVGYLNVNSSSDGIRMRLDGSNGDLLETLRIGETASNENISVLVPGGPGFVGSGYTTNPQPRGWMLGFNGGGGLEWVKRYTIPGTSNYEIRVDNSLSGGLIFTPYGQGPNHPEAYLVKTDDSGDITWAKAYSFDGTGRTQQVKSAPDGGYVVVGFCTGVGEDFFILKTDADGNVEGCCPMDAPVTVETISPPSGVIPVNGYWASNPENASGQNQDVGLDETNLCNGNDCCPTDAGTMLEETLHVCVNQAATFTHNGDEVLDNDDLLQFILFSDPNDTLGSIIATSNTPTFTFNPATMQTGVTYYVAAIAGNNVGGNVDLNDPCLDISDNAALLVWHPLPEVLLQTDTNDVCPGNCHTLTAILTGMPPFTLTVTSPAGTTTVTIQDNTGTFEICLPPGTPPGSFTVQATALTDGFCSCN